MALFGQDQQKARHNIALLSSSDSIALANLPEFESHSAILKTDLPAQWDNSNQPYFRDLFEQEASECGQYAAIAFNFTYELAYRRNVSAKLPENQFPTHFTYNFMNGGNGWHGVNYFHSYEIVRTNGQPNVVDYGGIATGGPSRWLSGYDKYYRGMFNKVESVYQIRVDTPEGLLLFKNWLHNHANNEAVGGLGTFYSSSPWNPTLLPSGTPEAGKHVIHTFVGPAGHALTVTGWNDSIRWDYNNDGEYTNDIDINGDGMVTMKDWEIGGLLFMDSYIGGLGWADSAYCYVMYKTLAEKPINGGIWNQAVHIVKVKEDYAPILTMKVKLKHTSRNKIKVLAGVSNKPECSNPDFTMGFPIFDYQGGNQYMQGGYTIPDNKVIEFGLDITPLLGEIDSGQDSKFFLQIHEDDPLNAGTGEIEEFSVYCYTNGTTEFNYPISDIPIIENGITTLGITTHFEFNQLSIGTNGLPVGIIDEPYNHQLIANGGKPPYDWNIIHPYEMESSTSEMPSITENKLTPSDSVLGIAVQALDFSFPLYGHLFDTLYIHTEGFITFDSQEFPWPYLFDEHLMIKKLKTIAPYLNSKIVLDTTNGDGIWFEGNENQATIRWRCTSVSPELSNINFASILFPSGKLEFYFGDNNMFIDHKWASGISNGDDVNFHFANPDKNKLSLTPHELPKGMSFSADGILSGVPQNKYSALPIEFVVTDDNNVAVRKTLTFNSWYANIEERQTPLTNFQIFPNPVKDQINIRFELQKESNINISIIDLHGKTIATLLTDSFLKGDYTFNYQISHLLLDGLNDGIYICSLQAGLTIYSKKILILNQ